MVDEYDWDALAPGVDRLCAEAGAHSDSDRRAADRHRTSTGITLEPYRDERLARFHAELWDVVTPFARGTVAPFYLRTAGCHT